MNHISTLTVTRQYIENQVRRAARQNTDDILQVVLSMMSAVDERFRTQEIAMNKLHKQLKTKATGKDVSIGD